MAKRRKRAPKGKARAQRAKPEAMRLPGGRTLETVRVTDPEGRPVTLVRTVDTLARMRKAGTITRAMHQAARDFQAHFTIAAYDTTATASIVRVRRLRGEKMTWNDDVTVRQIAARDRVHDALDALGGMASPGGSCVWHVVGLQSSLREWALRQGWNGRPMQLNQATGVLLTALGILAVHYGYERPRRAG